MKKWIIRLVLLSGFFLCFNALQPVEVQAQCPMCRMSAETNMKNGGTAGKGLNAGILYMLAMPYLIVGTVGYIWWRNRRKEEEM